jgi:hypothetical protein
MKRSLSRVVALTLYHFDDGVRKDGPPPGVRGDLTDVVGDLTGVRGDLSGVWGDIADCGLTDDDRRRGVSVEDLIARPEDETPEAAQEAMVDDYGNPLTRIGRARASWHRRLGRASFVPMGGRMIADPDVLPLRYGVARRWRDEWGGVIAFVPSFDIVGYTHWWEAQVFKAARSFGKIPEAAQEAAEKEDGDEK